MACVPLSERVRPFWLLLGAFVLLSAELCSAAHHPSVGSKHARSIFEDKKCVKTPKEFVKAFLKRENRCVSPNILVRLQSDNGAGGAPQARKLFASRLSARPVTFFSYDDTPDKYLRFGVPMAIGDLTGNPASGGNADSSFDGLEDLSSFLGMLAQVGYDSTNSFITGTVALIVTKRPSQYPLDNSFVPTWRNVVAYFNRYLAWVAKDPKFKLSKKVADFFNGKTFAELTSCPTACTFEDREFPNPPSSVRPARTGTRNSATQCINPNATRYELTEPTGFDEWDASCSPLWKQAKAFADGLCTNGSDPTVIKSFGAELVKKLKTLPTIEEQAMYFRAYLITACGGTFNTLFSGNGFTYTGTGGLIAPLGAEILLGASPHLNMDNDVSSLGSIEYVYFCSGGQFSRDPNFKCPLST